MNSPEYDDFIDMFSVPTPASSLSPTPVASPSNEPSQDVIYDSLPPMEQSTIPESPLKYLLPVDSKPPIFSKPPVVSRPPEVFNLPPAKKVAVKKVDSAIHRECSPRSRERRNEERRNEERRMRKDEMRKAGMWKDRRRKEGHEIPAQQGHFHADFIYQEPNTKRVFVLFCKDNYAPPPKKKTLVDNFKRAIVEAKHVNEFRPDDVLWEKISKGLLKNPDRAMKNAVKRPHSA
ncbi:hypothetical protein TNCV_847501 [Trichonephila clavipes]|nr:hypothetical protein TNCV_847501 [Trichonephila clavipes]